MASYHDRLEALQTDVWVISFSDQMTWAQRWVGGMNVPFTMLIDHQRDLYGAFALNHSIANTWNLRTIWYYTKAFFAGRRIPLIKGDPHQMGGDVVVDRDGVVRYIYRSQEPTDRPEIDTLLGVLAGL
ncbi:MAG: hypothetical protein GYB68_13150 [Chloroflexi bacterium]|nr:hypothetical protein [Chloroflexota bacterium]